MPSERSLPFLQPERPTQFSALGYLFGKFESNPDEAPKEKIKGLMRLKQGISIETIIRRNSWKKITQNPKWGLEKAYLWRVYFRTTTDGKLTQLEITQFAPIEGKTTLRHSLPVETGVDLFRIRGVISEVKDQTVVVCVERNPTTPAGKENTFKWKPFLLTLQGSLSPEPEKGQFWELICKREGELLRLLEAKCVEENPEALRRSLFPQPESPQSQPESPQPQPESPQPQPESPQPESPQSQPPPTPSDVIMISGRTPEITVKFTSRPDLPKKGKKVTLLVTGENGIVVKAQLNRKTLIRHVGKMDKYADWVAALSGKIASVSPEGIIELERVGINVFEKKEKAAPDEKKGKAASESGSRKTDQDTASSTAPQQLPTDQDTASSTAPQQLPADQDTASSTVPQQLPKRPKQVFRLVK
ncbi:MAG: hypothetical protein AB4426_12395 [Xenococcaceae cyanobacterium]